MRVVLDTNILISALIFPGGTPWKVFQEVLRGTIRNTTSAYIIDELSRVLTLKFGRDESFVRGSINLVRRSSIVLTVPTRQLDAPVEESDLPVVACAVEAGAKYLVTGDKGVLAAGAYRGVRFVTATETMRMIISEGP